MPRRIGLTLGILAASLAAPCPALPCTLCSGGLLTSQTLRQDGAQAKLVLYGTLANPRLNAGTGGLGGGTTDLRIEQVLKSDPFLGDKRVIEIPRYVPVDAKDPPKFLVFCDVFNGKLDPYRGTPVKSAAIVDYLKGAMALDAKDRPQALLYFFRYLDHADADVANDAYLEFAKASDQEIGQVAAKLSPEKLGRLLKDPQTPANRLGLYGFLLGACGAADAEAAPLLQSMVQTPTERTREGLSGLLAGYIQLRPREGWDLVRTVLRDSRKPFPERSAVLSTLRFYHGWKPEETRAEILRGLEVLLDQGDIADLAVEDLRRWQMWDLTPGVLAQYGKKSHEAPIMRRAIVRYALCCPRPEAARFVAERRKEDAEMVHEVEESLQFERRK